ncbi:MAG TPA: preprotein translocase subunit SecG [Chitinophagales bacterium]|nr:preprotein translocase subunit SecG [Chitinophagales bacterium]
MYAFITIIIVVICALLGAVVLIQNPKGGGLNASFGGVGQQLLGARRSTDIVEKLTWGFAVALIVLCLSTAFFVDKKAVRKEEVQTSEIEKMEKGKGAFQQPVSTQQQPAAQQQPATPTEPAK